MLQKNGICAKVSKIAPDSVLFLKLKASSYTLRRYGSISDSLSKVYLFSPFKTDWIVYG